MRKEYDPYVWRRKALDTLLNCKEIKNLDDKYLLEKGLSIKRKNCSLLRWLIKSIVYPFKFRYKCEIEFSKIQLIINLYF